jgi:hypothetical protein
VVMGEGYRVTSRGRQVVTGPRLTRSNAGWGPCCCYHALLVLYCTIGQPGLP